jgi:hypothetical protein
MLSKRWAISATGPTVVLSGALFLLAAHRSAAAPPESPKASSYAPAADLAAQVDFYLNRLSESLANQAEYDGAKQSRVHKDASTVAALVLVLGRHDEPNKYQSAAASMIQAAQALVEGGEDFGKARSALDALNQAAASGKGDAPAWADVAPLGALMKQVPIVNNSLRRSLEPSRFKKLSAQVAQQAATLAAIAQASLFDESMVSDAADTDKWRQFCAQMRDAAGAMNSAAHAGDQAATAAAQKRLTQSCDACHAVFRDK